VHTLTAWSTICDQRRVDLAERDLLRTVLSAYLIRASKERRKVDALSIL
jgi:hypothetical protein